MIGGGIYFSQKSQRSINTCIIEAMLRPDTQINPLTFSSMAGFIFTLHRDGGLVDANGSTFIRSDNISSVTGKRKLKAGAGGVVVSTLVIKIVLKQKDPDPTDAVPTDTVPTDAVPVPTDAVPDPTDTDPDLDGVTSASGATPASADATPAYAVLDDLQLVFQGSDPDDPDNKIEKSSLEQDEIITEQTNHNRLYQTFHLGEKLVPSLVGDLIECGAPDIQRIIAAIEQKPVIDQVKRDKVICVFEYFASQITAHTTSVVMMCMEMVGDDTKSEGVNTYQVTSSIDDHSLKLAAARGACAIQLLCMRKSKMELVDAHEGNWFIDTTNPDNVRAIDFGRLEDITEKAKILDQIWRYIRLRQSSFSTITSRPTFLSKLTKANLSNYYDQFINILEQKSPLPFLIEISRDRSRPITQDQKSRFNVHRNIHFCLVFAALIDNAITSLSYADWDQAQMIWAYEAIWGLSIQSDKNKKYPLHHIPILDFDYDKFIENMKENMKKDGTSPRRVIKSYDEIARLITLYTSTPHETVAKPRMRLVAPGITAEHMGEFVHFSSVAVAPPLCPPGGGGAGCIGMGGSRSGGRYNKSTRRGRRYNKSTRRGRKYSKSNTRRGRKYSKSTRRGRHHHRRTYQQ